MSTIDFESLTRTLKTIMKNRKINYRELAERLEMSESGVKKIMSGKDCSMNRLLSICDSIGVSFPDVVEAARNRGPKVVRLTEEQIDFFMENPNYFQCLMELSRAQHDRETLAERTGLDARSIERYLLKLDRLGLIVLNVDGSVGSAITQKDGHDHIQIAIPATLGKRVNQDRELRLLKRIHELYDGTPDYSNELLKRISGMMMQDEMRVTEKTAEALREELFALLTKYVGISARDQSLHPDDQLLTIGAIFAMGPFDGRYSVSALE